LHAQRAVLAATLTNREEALSLVSGRNRAGLDSDLALRQAQGRVPAARAELAATDEAIALTRNAIAALLGDGPDRALTITPPTLVVEQVRGVPADASIALIGRRPDIAAARAGVEAAASRIKVARAAFMPNISLSGLIGLQSLGFNQLFESGSRYGNAGAAITLPIFRGGALAGQYRGARGTYDEAVAHYDGTLVQALRQVADTMASRQALGQRLSETRLSLRHATEAHALARRRYEAGLSTYLDVLTAQDAVLQGQRAVADMETRAFALDVTMVRALGGGFTHS
jgi:NodT family efflux transporter outer membrane factor (OMF) lipoprotein